jgi:hypothetical protein
MLNIGPNIFFQPIYTGETSSLLIPWILATGLWNDSGKWYDSENWID